MFFALRIFVPYHPMYYFITLLSTDRGQASPMQIGTTFKPQPVTDKIADVLLAPIMTAVSADSIIEVSVS